MKKVKWLIMFFTVLTLLLPAGDWADAQKRLAQIQRDIIKYNLGWKAGMNPKFLEYCLNGETSLGAIKSKGIVITPRKIKAEALPSYYDWRNYNGHNYITPIKDQGSCGSCWAFAALGVVEAMFKIEKDRPDLNPDLSEQYLVSCSGEGSCESGGSPFGAAEHVKNIGVVPEYCFSYVAGDIPCNMCNEGGFIKSKVTEVWYVTGDIRDDNAIRQAIATGGPIIVTFAVPEDFFTYESGVYSPSPSAQIAGYHAVVMVGYDDTLDCWICKNSWGTGFGESGYFRIKRGTICDIETGSSAVSGVEIIKIAGY